MRFSIHDMPGIPSLANATMSKARNKAVSDQLSAFSSQPETKIHTCAILRFVFHASAFSLTRTVYVFVPQHFLYFLPLPHGHGSLRPTLGCCWWTGWPAGGVGPGSMPPDCSMYCSAAAEASSCVVEVIS